MIVTPGSTFTAIIEGVPTGVGASLGVRIINASDDTVTLARTTSGLAEAVAGSGVYEIQLVAPSTAGEYILVWDDATTEYASEPLTVGGVAPPAGVTITPGAALYRLPHSNATLTLVEAGSAVEDWDAVATRATVWSGIAQAYVMRADSREGTADGSASSVVTSRTVLVPRPIPVSIGATLTLVTRDGRTERVTVRGVDYQTPPAGVSAPVRVTGEVA